MKKRKVIAFIIALTMLFCSPIDSAGFAFYFLVWLPIAALMMAYAGAFKRPHPRKTR